jgi:hypothetical protein
VVADLVHSETAFGDDLLERNAAFRVLPEVLARGGDGTAVFRGRFLVVTREHHFEQSDDGVELGGAELIEQLMCLLSVHSTTTVSYAGGRLPSGFDGHAGAPHARPLPR